MQSLLNKRMWKRKNQETITLRLSTDIQNTFGGSTPTCRTSLRVLQDRAWANQMDVFCLVPELTACPHWPPGVLLHTSQEAAKADPVSSPTHPCQLATVSSGWGRRGGTEKPCCKPPPPPRAGWPCCWGHVGVGPVCTGGVPFSPTQVSWQLQLAACCFCGRAAAGHRP